MMTSAYILQLYKIKAQLEQALNECNAAIEREVKVSESFDPDRPYTNADTNGNY